MSAGKRNALLYPSNGRSCSPVQLASCSQAALWSQPEDSSSCSPGIAFYLLSTSFRLQQYFSKWSKIFKAATTIWLGQAAGFCFGREVIPTTPLSLRETGIDVSSSMSFRNMPFTPNSCHTSQGQGSRSAEHPPGSHTAMDCETRAFTPLVLLPLQSYLTF